MLVPLWLRLKKQFGVPFLVFMDDVLVMCESAQETHDVHRFLVNTLHKEYALSLNAAKTQSGRFSRQAVDFCGWRFQGGYATVSPAKAEAFKVGLEETARDCKKTKKDIHGFIKRINHRIDGFGNYYKHGTGTGKQFEALDVVVRRVVRKHLSETTPRSIRNGALEELGLHSLSAIYGQIQERKQNKGKGTARRLRKTGFTPPHLTATPQTYATPPTAGTLDGAEMLRLLNVCEKIQSQLTEMLALQRKQTRLLGELAALPEIRY
jgi:hypothetical protein